MIDFDLTANYVYRDLSVQFNCIEKVKIQQGLFRGLYERHLFGFSDKPIINQLAAVCFNKDNPMMALYGFVYLDKFIPGKGDHIYVKIDLTKRLLIDSAFNANWYVRNKFTARAKQILEKEAVC